MNPLSPTTSPITAPSLAPAAGARRDTNFLDLLSSSIQNVESQAAQSKQAVQQFLSGEAGDIHKVAIASQRAELSAELFMQVRNKMISAYQEIMKMQM